MKDSKRRHEKLERAGSYPSENDRSRCSFTRMV